MYYISTPVGDLYFESCSVNNFLIKYNNDNIIKHDKDIICLNIIWKEFTLFKKFIKMYDWCEMYVKNTDNGLFLYIKLEDSYYGEPCFKIFQNIL